MGKKVLESEMFLFEPLGMNKHVRVVVHAVFVHLPLNVPKCLTIHILWIMDLGTFSPCFEA